MLVKKVMRRRGDEAEGKGKGYRALGGEWRREKEEGERPTDRRMRPAEAFNWEEGWGFCFFGRGLTINTWAAKCYPTRSTLSLSKLYLSPVLPPALPFAVWIGGCLRARARR